MNSYDPLDQLGRLEKLLLHTGKAGSITEARELLGTYSIQIIVGPEVAESPVLQTTLLTAVNAARRAVHGEVRVVGLANDPLRVCVPGCKNIAEAAAFLGAACVEGADHSPALLIGSVDMPDARIAVRAAALGWAGGVYPAGEKLPGLSTPANPLGGILAGAVGVSELFEALRGSNARAGHRRIGYSAWNPAEDWLSASAQGPPLEYLPARLWVIGLGHLGQSLLWSLGMLPYSMPSDVHLVLQDFDRLTPANLDTSPVSFAQDIDRLKTRVSAAWAEGCDFNVRVVERPFADDFTLNDQEPRLAFCGVDNLRARAAVEKPGFDAVVEAGLGTDEEYQSFQLHTFPGPEVAAVRWRARKSEPGPDLSQGLVRYADEVGLDGCGRVRLAGVQVASSFVGLVAAAIAIGQMARPLHGATMNGAISGTLASSGPARTVDGVVGQTAARYGSTTTASQRARTQLLNNVTEYLVK